MLKNNSQLENWSMPGHSHVYKTKQNMYWCTVTHTLLVRELSFILSVSRASLTVLYYKGKQLFVNAFPVKSIPFSGYESKLTNL